MKAALGFSYRPERRGTPAAGSQQNAGLSPEGIRNSRSSTPALVAACARATRFGSSSPPASKSAIADLELAKVSRPRTVQRRSTQQISMVELPHRSPLAWDALRQTIWWLRLLLDEPAERSPVPQKV